jgi:hypothetical protein
MAEQRTAEQHNMEPQNIEGWNRCALPFEAIKLDRIPSFDIRYLLFSLLTPDTRNLKPNPSEQKVEPKTGKSNEKCKLSNEGCQKIL